MLKFMIKIKICKYIINVVYLFLLIKTIMSVAFKANALQ